MHIPKMFGHIIDNSTNGSILYILFIILLM